MTFFASLLHYFSFWFAPEDILDQVVTQRVTSLKDIDFKKMKKEGISLLIFDYDDTLSGHREPLSEATITFLKEHSEAMGNTEKSFHLVILSNRPSSNDQIRLVLDDTVLYFKIGSHRKPHPEALLTILKEHNLDPNKAAMIGDRGGTDIWGAYKLGIRERILVDPYSNRSKNNQPNIFFRIIRTLENSRLHNK